MAIHTVANASELSAALGSAAGGDEIVCAAGNYGQLWVTSNPAPNLTIRAADPLDRPVFDFIRVLNITSGLTLDGLASVYPSANAVGYAACRFYDCDGLTVRNCLFQGVFPNTAFGINTNNLTNWIFEDNEVVEWQHCMQLNVLDGFSFARNRLHSFYVDGIIAIQAHRNGSFIGNQIYDCHDVPPGAHTDLFQYAGSASIATPMENVEIAYNFLWNSNTSSSGCHGLRFGGENGRTYGPNIHIHNNVIRNMHIEGIIGNSFTSGLCENNSCYQAGGPGEISSIPEIRPQPNVPIQNNVGPGFILAGTGNVTVLYSDYPSFFVDAQGVGEKTLEQLRPLPGVLVGVGADFDAVIAAIGGQPQEPPQMPWTPFDTTPFEGSSDPDVIAMIQAFDAHVATQFNALETAVAALTDQSAAVADLQAKVGGAGNALLGQ